MYTIHTDDLVILSPPVYSWGNYYQLVKHMVSVMK